MAHAPRSQNPATPLANVAAAKKKVLDSDVYKNNTQVQSWLQGTWFPEEKSTQIMSLKHKIKYLSITTCRKELTKH